MAGEDWDELGEDLRDFRARIAELEGARGLAPDRRAPALEAALIELRYAADVLWPHYEERARRAGTGTGPGRREEQLLRLLFQRLPLPVALLDRDGTLRRLNQEAARLLGVGAGYAAGRPLASFLRPEDRAALRTQAAAVARGDGARGAGRRAVAGGRTGDAAAGHRRRGGDRPADGPQRRTGRLPGSRTPPGPPAARRLRHAARPRAPRAAGGRTGDAAAGHRRRGGDRPADGPHRRPRGDPAGGDPGAARDGRRLGDRRPGGGLRAAAALRRGRSAGARGRRRRGGPARPGPGGLPGGGRGGGGRGGHGAGAAGGRRLPGPGRRGQRAGHPGRGGLAGLSAGAPAGRRGRPGGGGRADAPAYRGRAGGGAGPFSMAEAGVLERVARHTGLALGGPLRPPP
ncbi:PAS domain-containing protein [Streptomyces triculaminicus]|uniref:PAS domain-containing protein n=1 Tax=Streptomyces triculaminicus TaxID=2816232 RepID=A0A939FRZ8_9ACTN|nr:PAS domain-containing protein [Streptomyces triculaminicus]